MIFKKYFENLNVLTPSDPWIPDEFLKFTKKN